MSGTVTVLYSHIWLRYYDWDCLLNYLDRYDVTSNVNETGQSVSALTSANEHYLSLGSLYQHTSDPV